MEHNNYLQDILKEEKTDEFKQLAESLIKEVSKLQEELYQHSNKLPEELKSSILSLSEAQSSICKFIIFNQKYL
jgi:hypothetical protein